MSFERPFGPMERSIRQDHRPSSSEIVRFNNLLLTGEIVNRMLDKHLVALGQNLYAEFPPAPSSSVGVPSPDAGRE